METERIRFKNYDLDHAFAELAYEATDPDVLEMRTRTGYRESSQDDPWLSRAWFGPDAWELARMSDVARRG